MTLSSRLLLPCNTGRVFVLKFKENDKKMFFWMQEPKSDKDEEFYKKANPMTSSTTLLLPAAQDWEGSTTLYYPY